MKYEYSGRVDTLSADVITFFFIYSYNEDIVDYIRVFDVEVKQNILVSRELLLYWCYILDLKAYSLTIDFPWLLSTTSKETRLLPNLQVSSKLFYTIFRSLKVIYQFHTNSAIVYIYICIQNKSFYRQLTAVIVTIEVSIFFPLLILE